MRWRTRLCSRVSQHDGRLWRRHDWRLRYCSRWSRAISARDVSVAGSSRRWGDEAELTDSCFYRRGGPTRTVKNGRFVTSAAFKYVSCLHLSHYKNSIVIAGVQPTEGSCSTFFATKYAELKYFDFLVKSFWVHFYSLKSSFVVISASSLHFHFVRSYLRRSSPFQVKPPPL